MESDNWESENWHDCVGVETKMQIRTIWLTSASGLQLLHSHELLHAGQEGGGRRGGSSTLGLRLRLLLHLLKQLRITTTHKPEFQRNRHFRQRSERQRNSFAKYLKLTVRYWGVSALRFQRLACICCSLFWSFSFWVSANLTTRGDEQPCNIWRQKWSASHVNPN